MNDKISMNKMGKVRKLLGDRYYLNAFYRMEDTKPEKETDKAKNTPKKRKYVRRVDATKAKSTTNTAKTGKKSKKKESE